MIRAGSLDRTIVIERVTTSVTTEGTPSEVWAPVATMRAQLVKRSADDTSHDTGAVTVTTVTFRTRFLDGVTPADRVTYAGRAFGIAEVVELGRREGLDLRCVARG
ncbi:phage head closure protein [Pinisolibacter sp.]|uniref:phage head closure protein n=1 Tax=Pinisolibacter sp. TaxID=2172024 RepID=UPI002FDCE022